MKNQLKNIIGQILIVILPKKASSIVSKGISFGINLSLTERLMREALLKNAEKSKDFETLSRFHFNYWSNSGKDYFSGKFAENVLESFFLPKCSFLFDLLKEQLEKEPKSFHTLVEIGTGDGSVLEHLSTRFSQLQNFVGIDLSAEQIEKNKKVYSKNNSLEFVASDAFEWVKKNGRSNTIFVTSRGVLEYFTEQKLQDFFTMLNGIDNIIFVAIEPTGVDHDFSKNPHTQLYGFESSFSHNYPRLFKNAGFTLWHESRILYSDDVYFNFIGARI